MILDSSVKGEGKGIQAQLRTIQYPDEQIERPKTDQMAQCQKCFYVCMRQAKFKLQRLTCGHHITHHPLTVTIQCYSKCPDDTSYECQTNQS